MSTLFLNTIHLGDLLPVFLFFLAAVGGGLHTGHVPGSGNLTSYQGSDPVPIALQVTV